jgi:hypothetical protein
MNNQNKTAGETAQLLYVVSYNYYNDSNVETFTDEAKAKEAFENEVITDNYARGYSEIGYEVYELPEGVEYTVDCDRIKVFNPTGRDRSARRETLAFYQEVDGEDEEVELEPIISYSSDKIVLTENEDGTYSDDTDSYETYEEAIESIRSYLYN